MAPRANVQTLLYLLLRLLLYNETVVCRKRGAGAPFFVCTLGPTMQWRGKRRRGPGRFCLARDLRNRQTTLLLLLFLLLFPLRRLINRARTSSSLLPPFSCAIVLPDVRPPKKESPALFIVAAGQTTTALLANSDKVLSRYKSSFSPVCMASDLAE